MDLVSHDARMAILAAVQAGTPPTAAQIARWVEHTDRLESTLADVVALATEAVESFRALEDRLLPLHPTSSSAEQAAMSRLLEAYQSRLAWARMLLGQEA